MLDEFEAFFHAKNIQLKDTGISVEVKRRSHPSGAINAILETDSYIASVSVWKTGAFDLDILDYGTGECLLAKRYDFETPKEMLSVLEDICTRLTDNNLSTFNEVLR